MVQGRHFPGITYYPGQLAREPSEAAAPNGASAHECFGVVIFDEGSQVTPEREQKIAPVPLTLLSRPLRKCRYYEQRFQYRNSAVGPWEQLSSATCINGIKGTHTADLGRWTTTNVTGGR